MGRYHDRARRLMLTVLGGLAEFETALIHARTGEGRERAKAIIPTPLHRVYACQLVELLMCHA